MAWTSPLTWAVGQLVTAAQLNTHIRDNELYLFGQKVEPGVVTDYAGSAAPTGWLLCDGSAVSRTTFAALFTAIGTTWGVGDGSTTFNVPDLRGRVPVGAGTGAGLTARTLAATGGEEAHALSIAELAAHAHTVSDPQHTHSEVAHNHGVTDPTHSHVLTGAGSNGGTINNVATTGAATAASGSLTSGQGTNSVATGVTTNNATPTINAASTGVTTTNTGSGTAHNTMPPFAVLNKLIKT